MFARIKEGIQSIQSGSPKTQRMWLWVVSLALFVIVVLAWLLFFHYPVDTTGSLTASSTNPFSELLKHVDSQFHAMTDAVNQGMNVIQGVASSSVILYASSTTPEGSTTPTLSSPSLESVTSSTTH